MRYSVFGHWLGLLDPKQSYGSFMPRGLDRRESSATSIRDAMLNSMQTLGVNGRNIVSDRHSDSDECNTADLY
jgi:hypothetical protein